MLIASCALEDVAQINGFAGRGEQEVVGWFIPGPKATIGSQSHSRKPIMGQSDPI